MALSNYFIRARYGSGRRGLVEVLASSRFNASLEDRLGPKAHDAGWRRGREAPFLHGGTPLSVLE